MIRGSGQQCPLSVVMPVYNEGAVIGEVVASVARDVLDLVPGSELIIIDDASTDDTAAALTAAALADTRIVVLSNSANAGHGRSVRRGLDAARGAWLFQIDSDGQVDLTEFAAFWARREEGDLLTGVRAVRHDPRHRLVLTRATRMIVAVVARRRLRDANAPFKLIRGTLYSHLAPMIPADSFAPSVLLAVGAVRARATVIEVEIRHLARQSGSSSLRLARLASAFGRSGWQTLRFGLQRAPRYQRFP